MARYSPTPMTRRHDRIVKVLDILARAFLAGLIVVFFVYAIWSAGCASPGGRVGTSEIDAKLTANTTASLKADADLRAEIRAQVKTDLTPQIAAIATQIDRLDSEVTVLRIGKIGGGGDSVTSWIYAIAGLVGAIAAAKGGSIWYESIDRPKRLARESGEHRDDAERLVAAEALRKMGSKYAAQPPVSRV